MLMKASTYSVASTVAKGRYRSRASATVWAAESASFEEVYLSLPPPYGGFFVHRVGGEI